MPESARFLFDTDFDTTPADEPRRRAKTPPPPPPRFSREELDAARAAALAEGRAQGMAEAEASREHAAAGAIEAVAREMSRLVEAYRAQRPAEARAALALAAAIARKIAPHLAGGGSAAAVEQFIAAQLSEIVDEPRVVVRLAAGEIDPIAERLDEVARQVGFPGEIVALSDGAIEAGDCRIEWADGGTERRLARKLDEIDALVAAFFEAPPEDASADEAPAEAAATPPRPDSEPSAEE